MRLQTRRGEVIFSGGLQTALVPFCGSGIFFFRKSIPTAGACSWGQRRTPKLDRVVEAAAAKIVSTRPRLDQIRNSHAFPPIAIGGAAFTPDQGAQSSSMIRLQR
jgi:hypothetical protein